MNRLLLDTTLLIDVSKNYEAMLTSLNARVAKSAILGVSALSVTEYFSGVLVPERRRWQRWLADFEHWSISRQVAVLAGAFRYDLAHQGRVLRIPDAAMAATTAVAAIAASQAISRMTRRRVSS